MRKNGFTLIELLAVIVILAIIALIATPIILGIINDAREKANERSAELYASAVRNAVASYQLTGTNAPTSFEDLNIQYDGDVECATQELYADGSFYIANCTVNGTEVDYTYGEQQVTQVYKPQYYWFEMNSYGNIIGDALPSTAKPKASDIDTQGNPFYIGLDAEDGKVTAAYACFTRNGTEYCLKGNDDIEVYETNKTVLEEAFGASACLFDGGSSGCSADDLNAGANSSGIVNAGDCGVDGDFYCIES